MKTYNKLVRDNIPDIIKANGGTCTTKIMNDIEYWAELHSKLYEEMEEYYASGELEELADIIEVIHAIVKQRGESIEKLNDIINKKRLEKGSFDKKIKLLSASDNTD